MTIKEAILILIDIHDFEVCGRENREAIDTVISALIKQSWIPIQTRPLTEEEKRDMPNADFYYACALPDDEETVLVTTRYGDVEKAVFVSDADGCYFEEYEEDGDVLAWMPLPKRYEPQESEE